MCDYCSWIEQILARINVESKLLQERIPPPRVDPTVIVHGGAGIIPKTKRKFMLEEVKSAALEAYKTLIEGYTAVDAVDTAISRMENTLYLNYMEEAYTHTNEEIIMDAAIMTNNLNAGCVGVVCGIEHPIKLETEGNEELRKSDSIVSFHEARTVGAVAYDRKKHLSSGISTMGESMTVIRSLNAIGTVIGCGIYADENGCCSISGNSKTIYCYAPARKIVRRFNSKTTMMLEINEELEKFENETGESQIGVIALNKKGEPSVSFKSLDFPWACCRNGCIYYGCKECDKFCEEITNLSRPLDCMCERSI
ncbi:isoaspartyl peptidase/L-asparaginase-like isoform X3 [Polistes fuscatus]|uniref:isoaspartyl peptidase/L-asparaginase-like isoform X3 n=1 Tax=Polistes fuscatus TaxID=30207 RepID=UPI001CA9ABF6|nr:isoaspartyl peptidase/L-asparaginase-like isoform X3 [Polistes fuscatus]